MIDFEEHLLLVNLCGSYISDWYAASFNVFNCLLCILLCYYVIGHNKRRVIDWLIDWLIDRSIDRLIDSTPLFYIFMKGLPRKIDSSMLMCYCCYLAQNDLPEKLPSGSRYDWCLITTTLCFAGLSSARSTRNQRTGIDSAVIGAKSTTPGIFDTLDRNCGTEFTVEKHRGWRSEAVDC